MAQFFPNTTPGGLPPDFSPTPREVRAPRFDENGNVLTQTDDLESIPVDDNDTWHLYPGDKFPIPAGTKSLCGIVSRYTLEDGGDYGEMNPEEDRTCAVCKNIAADINDADERDKKGWKNVE